MEQRSEGRILLTPGLAAQRKGVSRRTIYRAIELWLRGDRVRGLRAENCGIGIAKPRYRIHARDLDDWAGRIRLQ